MEEAKTLEIEELQFALQQLQLKESKAMLEKEREAAQRLFFWAKLFFFSKGVAEKLTIENKNVNGKVVDESVGCAFC
jgi:predicted metal-binding protein